MSAFKTMGMIAAFALLATSTQARELNGKDAERSADLAKFAVTNVRDILGCQTDGAAYAIERSANGKRVMLACGSVLDRSAKGGAITCATGKVEALNNSKLPAPSTASRRAVQELCRM